MRAKAQDVYEYTLTERNLITIRDVWPSFNFKQKNAEYFE